MVSIASSNICGLLLLFGLEKAERGGGRLATAAVLRN